MNLNSYLKPLDEENFNTAILLYSSDLSHDELIELIKTDSVVRKQAAVLMLDKVTNVEEAQILLDNLTGQDGKVREAISFKLNEFTSDKSLFKYFNANPNTEIFLQGALDINGNICRNVISAMKNFKVNQKFVKSLITYLLPLTTELLEKVEKFNLQDGKYKINKEVFKLYWALEVVYEFADFIFLDEIKSILIRAAKVSDYTIREKVAKILTKNFNDSELLTLKEALKADENYYVRRFN